MAFLHFQKPPKPPGVTTHIVSFPLPLAAIYPYPPAPKTATTSLLDSPPTHTTDQSAHSIFLISLSHFSTTLTMSLYPQLSSTSPGSPPHPGDTRSVWAALLPIVALFLHCHTTKKTEQSLRNTSRAERDPEMESSPRRTRAPPSHRLPRVCMVLITAV